jgi:hypothetical protein
MLKKRRAIIRAVAENISPLESLPQDPWALEPDDLRNQVQRRLSTLREADSKLLRRRLVTGLAKAGVQIGPSLFMLGIPATSPDDLTPTDMGKLLRYIRINFPSTIKALDGLLVELLVGKAEPAHTARGMDEAA